MACPARRGSQQDIAKREIEILVGDLDDPWDDEITPEQALAWRFARSRPCHERAPRPAALPMNPSHGPWRRVNAQAVEADIRTVPEPGGALLLGGGIAWVAALGRRRRLASS